jgi:cytochrome c oxidase subunit 2
MQTFRLFPDQASTFAWQVDALYLFLLGVSVFFSLLIFASLVYLGIKYRRRPGSRSAEVQSSMKLEAVWTAIPAALTMVMFAWGSSLYLNESLPPAGAEEVFVVGQQWMWKVQHSNGRREINELHVPVGRPVKLTLTSQDVIHSFYVPAFRVKQDAVPGTYRTLWFEATLPGEYHLFCAEYCGTSHSRMIGRVVVMRDVDYQTWLGSGTERPPAESGKQLFTDFDCVSCHASGARENAPVLGGRYGKQVVLEDGRTVLFDETYIRESIVDPQAKIVQGFAPRMPSFRGQLSEEQLMALIAYIKSLTPERSHEPEKGRTP